MLILTHTEVTNIMSTVYTTLDMVIDTRTKVLIKSGTPEMLYVELRAKKLLKLHRLQ